MCAMNHLKRDALVMKLDTFGGGNSLEICIVAPVEPRRMLVVEADFGEEGRRRVPLEFHGPNQALVDIHLVPIQCGLGSENGRIESLQQTPLVETQFLWPPCRCTANSSSKLPHSSRQTPPFPLFCVCFVRPPAYFQKRKGEFVMSPPPS